MLSFAAQNWDKALAPTRATLHGGYASRVASRITPRLYLTDYWTARDGEKLSELGITHVISVIEHEPQIPDVIPPSQRLHLPLMDHSDVTILVHLDTTTAFIVAALKENGTNKVMVHCMQGISRSATVVCAYLVATVDLSGPESIAHVQSLRGVVCPNSGFREQLDRYASTIAKHKPKRQLLLPSVFKFTTTVASQIRKLREGEAAEEQSCNKGLTKG